MMWTRGQCRTAPGSSKNHSERNCIASTPGGTTPYQGDARHVIRSGRSPRRVARLLAGRVERVRGTMKTTMKAGDAGRRARRDGTPTNDLPVVSFADARAWSRWLASHHA